MVNVKSKTLRQKVRKAEKALSVCSDAVIAAKLALLDVVDQIPWAGEISDSKGEARRRKKTATKAERMELLRRVTPQQHRRPKPMKESTCVSIVRNTNPAEHADEHP